MLKFTDSETKIVKDHITAQLLIHNRITVESVYNVVKIQLSSEFTSDTHIVKFRNAMNDLLANSPELTIVKGRYGGIKLAATKEEKEIPPEDLEIKEEPVEEQPIEKPKEVSNDYKELKNAYIALLDKEESKSKEIDLWIGENYYKVPITESYMFTLLINVMKAKESTQGKIFALGKRYSCYNDLEYEILDRFLFFLLKARIIDYPKELPPDRR